MALRRSNRRITITGSTVFAASTPMIQPTIKENVDDGNASPQWVSAEEAFGNIKTPKFTKMTRRTTLTRQNIFNDEDTIIGGAAADIDGFKAPRFFIPVSPPGVKTRSRRSSIHMGPPKPVKAKKVGNLTGGKKVNSTIGKNETKVTHKVASKRSSEIMTDIKDKKPAGTKISSRKSLSKRAADGGDAEFTSIERFSPISDADAKISIKKPRRSMRYSQLESEEKVVFSETTDCMHEFQTPRTHIPQGDEPKQINENCHTFRSMSSETPKAPTSTTPRKTLTQSARTRRNVPKSDDSEKTDKTELTVKSRAKTPKLSPPVSPLASQSTGFKRQMSEEENSEIERVVKKMFSPTKFYSSKELSYKQKVMSPNTGKASSSPARTAIVRNSVNTGRKSPARKVLETSVTQKTPSRAAPKARKILGVSTNSISVNDRMQNMNKKSVQQKERVTADETSLSQSDSDASFREEAENNMTLSHSSHSQWCTIL